MKGMKNIIKKFQVVVLVVLIGLGTMSITNINPFQNNNSNLYMSSEHFSNQYSIHSLKNIRLRNTAVATANLPANTQTSSNWSGYITTPASSIYTSISGSWTIPSISSNKGESIGAQWIGLGGVSSSDLLQMGTMEEIENGQTTVEVFWEKLPDASQNIMSLPVGSTINVSIYKSSNSDSTWNLTFTANEPNGTVQTKTITTTLDSSYAQGIGTSAEWISEDPSNENSELLPLANMGTIKYKSAKVNGQALNASGNTVEPVAMVSNGNIAIYPSELGSDGESFTTTSTNLSTNSNTNVNPYSRNNPGFRHRVSKAPMPLQIRERIHYGF